MLIYKIENDASKLRDVLTSGFSVPELTTVGQLNLYPADDVTHDVEREVNLSSEDIPDGTFIPFKVRVGELKIDAKELTARHKAKLRAEYQRTGEQASATTSKRLKKKAREELEDETKPTPAFVDVIFVSTSRGDYVQIAAGVATADKLAAWLFALADVKALPLLDSKGVCLHALEKQSLSILGPLTYKADKLKVQISDTTAPATPESTTSRKAGRTLVKASVAITCSDDPGAGVVLALSSDGSYKIVSTVGDRYEAMQGEDGHKALAAVDAAVVLQPAIEAITVPQ